VISEKSVYEPASATLEISGTASPSATVCATATGDSFFLLMIDLCPLTGGPSQDRALFPQPIALVYGLL
jgi:hypothetical protein